MNIAKNIAERAAQAKLALAKPELFIPEWRLETSWFVERGVIDADTFEKRVGVQSRPISRVSELEMAQAAISALRQRTACSLENCIGLVLAGSSLGQVPDADQILAGESATQSEPLFLSWPNAQQVALELRDWINRRIPDELVCGINWGCTGFVRALQQCLALCAKRAPSLDEFILLVTVNRLSERMDFADKECAIFGDGASASLLVNPKCASLGALFSVLDAQTKVAETRTSGIPFFCERKEACLLPTPEGGAARSGERVCVRMDGQPVAQAAPKRMAEAALEILEANNLSVAALERWEAHQAGALITGGLSRELGRRGVSGVSPTRIQMSGNQSSSSIPWRLAEDWGDLPPRIGLTATGAGIPGRKQMARGGAVLVKSSLGF